MCKHRVIHVFYLINIRQFVNTVRLRVHNFEACSYSNHAHDQQEKLKFKKCSTEKGAIKIFSLRSLSGYF